MAITLTALSLLFVSCDSETETETEKVSVTLQNNVITTYINISYNSYNDS